MIIVVFNERKRAWVLKFAVFITSFSHICRVLVLLQLTKSPGSLCLCVCVCYTEILFSDLEMGRSCPSTRSLLSWAVIVS